MSLFPGWGTIDGANFWSNFFFWASLVALTGLGIFEAVSHHYTVRKDELVGIEQNDTQRRHDEDMARVQKDASAANTRAAEAITRAAEAITRAANLEKEAAATNERAAQIMAATAWRQFQPAQVDALARSLSRTQSKVLVAWVGNDAESFSLAAQFTNVLAASHWETQLSARTYPGNLIWGIVVPPSADAPETSQVLLEAFAAAGIPTSADALPPQGMSFGTAEAPPGFATVLFGSKKPSFTQSPR